MTWDLYKYSGRKCLRCGNTSKRGAANRYTEEVLCKKCIDKVQDEKVDIMERMKEIEDILEQRYGQEIKGENKVLLDELKQLNRIMELIP